MPAPAVAEPEKTESSSTLTTSSQYVTHLTSPSNSATFEPFVDPAITARPMVDEHQRALDDSDS
jgi:hypothetical protein